MNGFLQWKKLNRRLGQYKVKYINNPFDMVLKATKELYPKTRAWIQFNSSIKFKRFLWFRFGYCGYKNFSDKNDIQVSVIDISTNIPFEAMVETLAHELAHVVVGLNERHDEKWLEAFDKINKKYYEIVLSRGAI